MTVLQGILLGLLQGLTEFLPVSSSGHLAMFQAVLGGREEAGLLFEVGLHVATLFAISARISTTSPVELWMTRRLLVSPRLTPMRSPKSPAIHASAPASAILVSSFASD